MNWKISLVGQSPVECKGNDLKAALAHYFESVKIPESGYLIVKQDKKEFQLAISDFTVIHNGEVVLGDPEKEAVDSNGTSNTFVQPSQYEGGPEYPFVAGLLLAIAIISLVAALIAAAALQTQGSTALAVSVLASGIIQMAVLSGLGQVIVYLNRITYELESKSS